MMKKSVGILGHRADPKKQILFSFKSRQGEEWPSDSEDSDYVPSDESEQEKTKKKMKSKRRIQNQSKNSPIKSKRRIQNQSKKSPQKAPLRPDTPLTNTISQWGTDLPPEILLHIFQYVVSQHGAVPFLVRASHVNRLWYDTSLDSSLWTDVDLSYGWIKSKNKTLKWLCENRLGKVQYLNLSSWKTFTIQELEIVAENCPLINYLNLSYCSKVNAVCVKLIADELVHLTGIDLSFTGLDACNSLKYLIEKRGQQLKSLTLCGTTLRGFNSVFNLICAVCFNLEVLDLSYAKFSSDYLTIPVEQFAWGCPKLRVFRIANALYRTNSVPVAERMASPGFPCLEELSLAITPEVVSLGVTTRLSDGYFFQRILKNAYKLQLLDVRGCNIGTGEDIYILPTLNLQYLYLANTHSPRAQEALRVLLNKWQHSLKEVDLSRIMCSSDAVNAALAQLSSNRSTSQLEVLKLTNSSVTMDGVRSVLRGCPNLHTLNLASCRHLPRGTKRDYVGGELMQLRKDVEEMFAELPMQCVLPARMISTQLYPLTFHATLELLSSPMKKKTKMDPNIAIQKELKKKRKIEKAIRQIEKKGRMLKPIDEIEGDRMLLKTIDTRKREPTALTFEESERRALLYKEWSRYKRYQHIVEMQQLTKAVAAQEKALQALKEESEELYKQAIQLDDNLPYTWTGPSFTPAIPDYDAPDGDYKDTTKTFDDLPIGPLFQKKNTRRR